MPTVAGSNMSRKTRQQITTAIRAAVNRELGAEPSKRVDGVAKWLAWHKQKAERLRSVASEPEAPFAEIPWEGSELRLKEPLSKWMPVTKAAIEKQETELRALVKKVIREETKYALENGWIMKSPCEVCGEVKVEAHHPDYNDPYTVKWLCFYHHHIEHGRKPKHRSITKNNWYTKFGGAAAQLDRASAF